MSLSDARYFRIIRGIPFFTNEKLNHSATLMIFTIIAAGRYLDQKKIAPFAGAKNNTTVWKEEEKPCGLLRKLLHKSIFSNWHAN